MTIEEIREQCESLSNEQLLLVVNNKRLYTEKIVRVAYQEIRRRGLSKQEIKEIEKVQSRQTISGDINEDILFWEKVLFFILWFPRINFFVLRDYRKRGYVLKIRQALYFRSIGFVFFIVSVYFVKWFESFPVGLVVWLSGFAVSFLLNKFYFKGKIQKYLEARLVEPPAK